jgi:AraC family transcriptional regulator of adaptative response/methylated-DNA-[protein]-cysteine methyltransferase
MNIPYGTTESYEGLARRIGVPRASRAVGHSNGLNRLAIVIPCHRVVNKNGDLGGYGGGLWRKQALLELERGERKYGEGTAEITRLASVARAELDGLRKIAVAGS